VAGALRDFGIEVIYIGATFDADALCNAAIQEDADAIILSGVSDEQVNMLSTLSELQSRRNIEDIPVVGIGRFTGPNPPAGLRAVFPPEGASAALMEWIRKEAKSEK
jgi:methylmalonyl-CoA mutase cobalamin-binding subunit